MEQLPPDGRFRSAHTTRFCFADDLRFRPGQPEPVSPVHSQTGALRALHRLAADGSGTESTEACLCQLHLPKPV